MKKESVLSIVLALVIVPALMAGGSQNQSTSTKPYPSDTVQVVVPYGAGGGSDTLTRATIAAIKFPAAMVAINIEGADGLVGTMEVFQAKPDGYKIMTHNLTDIMGYYLSGSVDRPLHTEMISICDMVADYNVIATNKVTGWKNIADIVSYAKAHPREIKWSCTGAQGIDYATTVLVLRDLGIEEYVTIVPYDGGAEGNVALMGNHVQVSTNTSSDIGGSVVSGDVIPLLVVNDVRIKALPNTPTTLEVGGTCTISCPRGFYAPPGTPQNIVTTIEAAMKAVSEDPAFIQRMEGLGFAVDFKSNAVASARMKAWSNDLQPIFDSLFE
jgi:tripartite-type tricarboxylate transporter receptor subunit TctC